MILITKTQYHSDKQGFERKIKDTDKKIPNTSYNTKPPEIESKISSVNDLVITAAPKTTALFTTAAVVDKMLAWGSKGLSRESIKPPNILDTVLLQN